jgi:hypothetical protein
MDCETEKLGFDSQQGNKISFLRNYIQIDLVPVGNEGSLPGLMCQGCEPEFSPSSSADVKNCGVISVLLHKWHGV